MDHKTIWIYKFKDGTKLKVLEKGLSDAEVRKLEELHGAWIEHTVDIKRAAFELAHSEIDGFVDFLIKERCQGCKCCDPKAEENKNVFCCEQGFAHWVMEMAERYKGEKHEMSL